MSEQGEEKKFSIVAVKKFFGMETREFMDEWNALSEEDKEDIRKGFMDGSMNY